MFIFFGVLAIIASAITLIISTFADPDNERAVKAVFGLVVARQALILLSVLCFLIEVGPALLELGTY